MTNVLLSCRCKRNYTPAPYAGDILLCVTHGEVMVVDGVLQLKCEDCSYTKTYSSLAPMSICTTATKHALKHSHRVGHQTEVDSSDRMCLHDHRKILEFTYGTPPF